MARRMNPGRAIERLDEQPGVVGERRQLCGPSGRRGLDARIFAKRHSVFIRLGQSELTGRHGGYPIRRKQFAHFGKLAWIVGGDHQTIGNQTTDDRRRIMRIRKLAARQYLSSDV